MRAGWREWEYDYECKLPWLVLKGQAAHSPCHSVQVWLAKTPHPEPVLVWSLNQVLMLAAKNAKAAGSDSALRINFWFPQGVRLHWGILGMYATKPEENVGCFLFFFLKDMSLMWNWGITLQLCKVHCKWSSYQRWMGRLTHTHTHTNNTEFTSEMECFGPCKSYFGSGSKRCGVQVGPNGFLVLEDRALTVSPAELRGVRWAWCPVLQSQFWRRGVLPTPALLLSECHCSIFQLVTNVRLFVFLLM